LTLPGTAYRFRSIVELQQLLRTVSARELAESVLDALETDGRALNAVAHIASGPALMAADAVDRDGRRRSTQSLHGIPYGVKDVFSTAGIPTTWGAPPFRTQILDTNAAVVERLNAGGAVLTAKLASIQLAGAGGYRSPATSLQGPGKNPWNARRWSGGSSSGPAIAVGAGILPFSIGSETTGSVVVPAAFCGVTGFRPSWGLVSQYGMLPVAWSVDKAGIVARTAADCRTVLGHIAGEDPRDPTTVEWRPRRHRSSRYRIGILQEFVDDFPATRRQFDAALGVLKTSGMRLQRTTLPDAPYQQLVARLLAGETAGAQEGLVRSDSLRGLLDSSQRAGLRSAGRQPVTLYARAVRDRVGAVRAIRSLFRSVDALVAPTQASEAPSLGIDLKSWPPRRRHHGFLGALAGLPGISVPMGLGDSGLPLGMSIVADHLRDEIALDIAELFQQHSDWHLARPGGLAA
jgi:aspartyl-tRNA(Asn)/glutamyl-tRNA(Gln) amidotransferase subunit A